MSRRGRYSECAALDAEKQVQGLAQDIVKSLSVFNSLSYIKTGSYVFNVTNRMLRRTLDLGRPARTIGDYGNTIDALYEIIYEGSGSLKRVPDGFKENKDFVGFTIKFLRADLRHDLGHGDEKEIRTKKQRLSMIYSKYAGKPSLGTLENSDFAKIQIELLVEVKSFLMAFEQQLRKAHSLESLARTEGP
jgi:hypothetical protein